MRRSRSTVRRFTVVFALAGAAFGCAAGAPSTSSSSSTCVDVPPLAPFTGATPPEARVVAQFEAGPFGTSVADLVASAALADDEPARVVELGRTQHASHHLVALRGGEPLHHHADHDLTVVMLQGFGSMLLGDRRTPVGEGSLLHVPSGVVHAFTNQSDGVAVAYVMYAPPLEAPDRVLVEACPAR